jgi:sec-independent protein translocase protein TatC
MPPRGSTSGRHPHDTMTDPNQRRRTRRHRAAVRAAPHGVARPAADLQLSALVAMALLAIWPGPQRPDRPDRRPIRAHMPPDAKLIAVGVFSPFFVPLKVLMMAGVLLALPWLMYQAWAFVAPGLYSHEKRLALPLIFFGSAAGLHRHRVRAVFRAGQDVRLHPGGSRRPAWRPRPISRPMWRPSCPVHRVWPGVPGADRGDAAGAHEHVSIEKLKEFRGYFIVVAFVIAAVITPPDVISQLALAVPMCMLYEAGIWRRAGSSSTPKAPEAEPWTPVNRRPGQALSGALRCAPRAGAGRAHARGHLQRPAFRPGAAA